MKAIFLCKNTDKIFRVFDAQTLAALQALTGVAQQIYTKEEILAEPARFAEVEIVFANDFIPEGGKVENGYYTMLGGRNNAYPYTVILDETGVITHVFVSSVTYDMLKTAVDEALQ